MLWIITDSGRNYQEETVIMKEAEETEKEAVRKQHRKQELAGKS